MVQIGDNVIEGQLGMDIDVAEKKKGWILFKAGGVKFGTEENTNSIG